MAARHWSVAVFGIMVGGKDRIGEEGKGDYLEVKKGEGVRVENVKEGLF